MKEFDHLSLVREALRDARARPQEALGGDLRPIVRIVQHWMQKNHPNVVSALRREGRDPRDYIRSCLVWIRSGGDESAPTP